MIVSFRHTLTKYVLTLLLVLVFLCASLWQSSHVHHQHGSSGAGLTFGHMPCVPEFSDGNLGDAGPHREHSHDAPDKTAHLYKHQAGWKTNRGKADGDSKLKIPAVLCTRDVAISAPESNAIQAPNVMANRGVGGARPLARAPPGISSIA